MTGDPDKEYGTNKPPPTPRVRERLKGDTVCLSTCQNPSHKHPSWLSHACATRKDSELEWLAKDHLETNPITIKPETVSHTAEQFSWVPLPYCSPPGCPFPIKSLALSAHVSPRTIHFWMLDKSPVSGPGRGPPSCNRFTYMQIIIIIFYSTMQFKVGLVWGCGMWILLRNCVYSIRRIDYEWYANFDCTEGQCSVLP